MTVKKSNIKIVSDSNDVWDLPETKFFYSAFSDTPNIGADELAALLSGKALVDLSDGEYIHWIQLTPDAIKTAKLRQ